MSGNSLIKQTRYTIAGIGLGLFLSCGGGRADSQPTLLPPTATVIFPAGTISQGTQLWESDGTATGTRLLKQINPQDWAFPNTIPTKFTLLNGVYYFPSQDAEHGYELWKTDGSDSGTSLVFDAISGPEQGIILSSNQPFVGAGGLYFNASWQNIWTSYLWNLSTTSGNVHRLQDGYTGGWSGSAHSFANWGAETLFLGLDYSLGWSLYQTNGTPAGTRILIPAGLVPLSGFAIQSDQAIFLGYKQSSSDLTTNGIWGCDLRTGIPQLLIPSTGINQLHWDESIPPRFNGDFTLVEIKESSNPERFGLWRTDGTPEGSFRLMDLGNPTNLIAQAYGFQGRTFFPADDGVHGVELWVTDGTADGTRLFKDLVPGLGSSFPGASYEYFLPTGGFMEFRGCLYFGAGGPEFSDHVLWVSDGTAEGTRPLVNFPGTDARVPKLPAAYCVAGDTLYFSAQTMGNAPYTRQLWRTDGSSGGTQRVTSFDFGDNWNPIWSIQPSPRP